jgi:hypothetical protein
LEILFLLGQRLHRFGELRRSDSRYHPTHADYHAARAGEGRIDKSHSLS